MELIKVIKAKYESNYSLHLIFSNGYEGVVDLEEKIFKDHRDIFKELKNQDIFKNIYLDAWTVCWKNGADLAPEFLYQLATEQQNKTTTNKGNRVTTQQPRPKANSK